MDIFLDNKLINLDSLINNKTSDIFFLDFSFVVI